jgi:DNA-binding NarL/FixJ family response regulator
LTISSIRILVVDDFAPWRSLLQTILQERPELQIVCEATDGLEAIQKARELQPDLILLDIGLPILNGIEAARRIRSLAPKSKILFISENYSADIAREALSTGGLGYVIKSDAGIELLTAVDAVILGKQFISARLAEHIGSGIANTQTTDRLRIKEILESFTPRLPRNQAATHRHEVHFYSDDTFPLNGLSRFVGASLMNGSVVVAIATEPHRDRFIEGLQGCGLDIRGAMNRGSFTMLDVAETTSGFMISGSVDPVRYLEGLADMAESALRASKSEHPRIAVCGELAVPLLAQGNTDAAIQIEQLSNEFATAYAMDILCVYPSESAPGEESSPVRQRICAEHSTIYSH